MTKIVQLPDLWVKMDMALALAILPLGTSAAILQTSNFVRCIRGDTGSSSTFNKWLVGDAGLRLADDVPLLAAMLERMIGKGLNRSVDHAMIKKDAQRSHVGLKEPLSGTVCDFAAALIKMVADRKDAKQATQTLDCIMRKALFQNLTDHSDPSGKITILHGATREWWRAGSDSERVARKANSQEIPKGDFIQYVVPPSPVDQLVFGFEMLTEPSLVGASWSDIGGWFPPQVQRAGKALLLLDEPLNDDDAYRAEGQGESAIQVVGVDLDRLSTTGKPAPTKARPPHDLYRLIGNRPQWPEGYAETMAMLTYVKRVAMLRTKTMNRNDLDATRSRKSCASPPQPISVPPLARLYQGRYRVV